MLTNLKSYLTLDITARYAYNSNGIRTLKWVDSVETKYIINGVDVVGGVSSGETTTYLRGVNLICTDEYYYVFDAHGDVVNLTDEYGVVVKTYEYDAFGVEKNRDDNDTNPFRYCGEYWDSETETYYLRARNYDPNLGRFTSEDTHWNVSNMIYGDNPQKINEREDKLGLKTYSYAPIISAIVQSGNLYVYCISNPVYYIDSSGNSIVVGLTIGLALCVADGLITGAVYKITGRNFLAGFVNGFVSSLITEVSTAIGGYIGTILGSAIGGALASIVEDLLFNRGEKTIEEIAESAAEAAARGLISGLATSYLEYAVELANEAGSAAELLMDYNENFGEAFRIFFEKLLLII